MHIDPDNLREATITVEGTTLRMLAQLSMTAFADLTLEEAHDVMNYTARLNPRQRQFNNEQVGAAIARRAKESGFFGDPHLPASYRGIEELQEKAKRLDKVEFRGTPTQGLTVMPGKVMDRSPSPAVHLVETPTAATKPPADPAPTAPPNGPVMTFTPIKESKL